MIKLLTLKHWQLFGLFVGLPLIFQVVTISAIMNSQNPTILMIIFPIMMILFIGLFFCWVYAIGTNLHKKLPATAKMSLTRFKIFLFIPIAYMLLLSIHMSCLFANITFVIQPQLSIFAGFMPLHLFSIFCIFYCLYFIAKALKTVEWQMPVTFSDFVKEFFLIWFFPVGIWVIQPRLNKLFDTTHIEDNNLTHYHNG